MRVLGTKFDEDGAKMGHDGAKLSEDAALSGTLAKEQRPIWALKRPSGKRHVEWPESPLAAIRLRLRVTIDSPLVCVTLAAGGPPRLNWEACPRKVSKCHASLFWVPRIHGAQFFIVNYGAKHCV